MQWFRPKSLSSLMLLGLLLIAGPLLFAVLNAALQIRTLADSSRRLVVEGVSTARASQDLYAQIDLLERTTSVNSVLGDQKLLDSYREQNAQLTATRELLQDRLRSRPARA